MSCRLALLLCVTPLTAGCQRSSDAAPPAASANPNTGDPALTGALADPIMVDPGLAQQADSHIAGRTPMPIEADVPLLRPTAPAVGPLLHAPAPITAASIGTAPTIAMFAASRIPNPACQAPLNYSSAWAARMPLSMPIYPEGQVQQAAGMDIAGCRLRVLRFVTGASPDQVIDFYYTHARRAGYDSRHRSLGAAHSLGGRRMADGSAYYVEASPQADGATAVEFAVDGTQ